MGLIILAIVGVSSIITVIVVFVLCAKRQSFTIAHDYDPNFVSPSVKAKNAYRVRHVHQPITSLTIENGHSKTRDDLADKGDYGVKKSASEVIANNNVRVDVAEETPEARLQRKDGTASASSPSHSAIDRLMPATGNEVHRESSKRKAPTAPGGSTPAGSTPSSASSPAKQKSLTSPTVSVTTPTRSSTTPPKVATSQGQRVAASNPQRESKKTAPTPNQAPTKAAASLIKKEAPIKTSPKAPSVRDTPPHSGTSSLPRATKTTPSPERVHYAKKSSTLPVRSSSKRQAPAAPGQAHPVNLIEPKTDNTVPSNEGTAKIENVDSKSTVAPGQNPKDDVTAGSDVPKKPNRSSRHVLDRLPSLPKENSFDSGLDVKQSDIASISTGSDSIDGPDEVNGKDSLEEDPYSLIRNGKLSEDSVEHDKAVDKDSVTPHRGDQNGEETPVSKDDGIVLELSTPDVTTDGRLKEEAVKAEPPYAKVIKRNKRNRANVRVHFNLENPEEIKAKKPPTPGPLVSMNSESKNEVHFDDIIPEGTSYD